MTTDDPRPTPTGPYTYTDGELTVTIGDPDGTGMIPVRMVWPGGMGEIVAGPKDLATLRDALAVALGDETGKGAAGDQHDTEDVPDDRS